MAIVVRVSLMVAALSAPLCSLDCILRPRAARVEGLGRANLPQLKVAPCPSRLCLGLELLESAGSDGGANAGGKLLIVSEIDGRQQRSSQKLAALGQMVQISTRVVAGRGTRTRFVERARIAGMARVLQYNRPMTGERYAMASVARGQHAVEHVDAAHHRFEDVLRRADPH